MTDEDALVVAARIAELPGLRLVGLMNYGNAYGTSDAAEQQRVGLREGQFAVEMAEALRRAGHAIEVVSVGSTPTARHASRVRGVTELRPGVYAFLDLKQVSLGPWSLDQCALTVLATVVSHARPDKYVLDAGLKAVAGENYEWGTYGRILGRPEIIVTRATEEHGIVMLPEGTANPQWKIGDRVRVIVNHAVRDHEHAGRALRRRRRAHRGPLAGHRPGPRPVSRAIALARGTAQGPEGAFAEPRSRRPGHSGLRLHRRQQRHRPGPWSGGRGDRGDAHPRTPQSRRPRVAGPTPQRRPRPRRGLEIASCWRRANGMPA